MRIGKGSHASFELWSNNEAFGNKIFTSESKCEEERVKFMTLKDLAILPPIVLPWNGAKSIAMMRMHMTLEHAIREKILSPRLLQKVVYVVTEMLMRMANKKKLMMDVHLGNVLLHFPSLSYQGMPRVYLNDPGFLHEFTTEVLPTHVRSCPFDPTYDLAFFSYSLIGYLRRLQYTPFPITPLSEEELIPYQRYIKAPHHWDMAVGRFPYRPEATLCVEEIARNGKRKKTTEVEEKSKRKKG